MIKRRNLRTRAIKMLVIDEADEVRGLAELAFPSPSSNDTHDTLRLCP